MEALNAEPETMPDAESDLVKRHRYGDESAFEEIYERYGGMVYNLALRFSGEPEEAADLTQEAFLKIHRHLGGFRGRSALRTWIYRVAVNCCRSRYRQQRAWRTRFELGTSESLEAWPDRRRDPEQRAVARSTWDLVEQSLRALPEIYREAENLRDIEGLTYEEIARDLKKRLGTERSRIARGRDRLRHLLEESR